MDQPTTIEELDHRQDHVLQQLAELNARVEALVGACLKERHRTNQGVNPSEPTTADSEPPL
jgi:hypothetical protein